MMPTRRLDRLRRKELVSEATSERQSTATRKPQILSGFRDHLPAQMLLRQRVIGAFREIFERHGFEPLETPAIELLEILTGKAGENEKLMYRFEDSGGRAVGLRYDLTVPLARVVAMHQQEIVLPFKRYHIAPAWRAEKAQRGRFREFWQCDADIAGSSSMLADAEAITVLAEALTAVNLPNFVIRINHRRVLESLARLAGVPAERAGGVFRSIDKLDKIGRGGVARELGEQGIEAAAAERVLSLVTAQGAPADLLAELRRELAEIPSAEEALRELEELFGYLGDLGVKSSSYVFDLALARGLDYYTGPVFEATVEEPKIGSVAGAGRYDGLVGAFLGRQVPATGMSLGLERIIEVVREFDLLPAPQTVADVFVAVFPDTLATAARIAGELRAAGLNADLSVLAGRSIGEQLKYADRRGIPLAVIAGANELASGSAAVKHLGSGEQRTVPLGELAEVIASWLESRAVR
jgi:histidyl-tRNA synthetase